MKLLTAVVVLIVAIFLLVMVGYRNVDDVKSAAPQAWADAGYKIEGYEGYQWEPITGGKVWHIVSRDNSPGVTYHGFFVKWGKEYHLYNLRAIDAIGPR